MIASPPIATTYMESYYVGSMTYSTCIWVLKILNPKGLNVLEVAKPDLGSATWPQIFFRFLKTFYGHVLCNKLHGSTNFMIFEPTDQKLWILGEVWTRRACTGTNHQKLTTCAKTCGQEEGEKIWEGLVYGTRTWSPGTIVGRKPAAAHTMSNSGWPSFLGNFKLFFTFLFGIVKMGLAFWENGCTTLPFFEAAPTVKMVKSSIPHGPSYPPLGIFFHKKVSLLKILQELLV